MLLLVLGLVASVAAGRDPRCVQYARGAEAITLSHKSDCTKFHICDVEGNALEMKCPAGLYFSVNEGVCSFDQSGCTGGQIPPKPMINNQDNNVNVIVPESQHEDKPFVTESLCLNQPNGVTLPVANDCFSYAVCIYNKPIILACHEGLAYDHGNKKCDFKEGTPCATPRLPQIIKPVEVPRNSELQTVPLVPVEQNQSWNTPIKPILPIPERPRPEISVLPAEPMKPQVPIMPPRMPIITIPELPAQSPIDVIAEQESEPYNSPMGFEDPRCNGRADPNYPRMMAHTRNCSKYLVCVGRMAIEKDCPTGQHWSIENNYCDFIYRANCRL